MSKMLVTILSAVAQAEPERILERTNEGHLNAKNKGVKFGRKQSIDRRQVFRLHRNGAGPTEIAQRMNYGRSTVYKILEDRG